MSNERFSTTRVTVWDPVVRVTHWLLVLTFAVAYLTRGGETPVHMWTGYCVGTLVLLRVVWGFVGSEYARFRDFTVAPVTVLRYFRDLLSGSARRYIGHSPAGSAMVLLLLLALAATVWAGLMVYAYDQQAGPLVAFVGTAGDAVAIKALEHYWKSVHEFCANFALLLIVLHIGGVLLASYVHKENLVAAMFTGRKHDDVRDVHEPESGPASAADRGRQEAPSRRP